MTIFSFNASFNCNRISSEILATHFDESWTHHLQLGLAKVIKFSQKCSEMYSGLKLNCYKYPRFIILLKH